MNDFDFLRTEYDDKCETKYEEVCKTVYDSVDDQVIISIHVLHI